MRELALHLLDIAENSVAAHASKIEIIVEERIQADRINLTVRDNGVGMDEKMVAQVTDPFVTSRTTRKVGLGIPLLKAAAEACCGTLTIASAPGQGTRVDVSMQRSHIDRMPLGDLPGTILTLVIAYPQIHWIFTYRVEERKYIFDNRPVQQELGDVPLTEPSVLAYLRETLTEGVAAIQPSPVDPFKIHS